MLSVGLQMFWVVTVKLQISVMEIMTSQNTILSLVLTSQKGNITSKIVIKSSQNKIVD